jgi:hypothetical protein
MVAAVVISAIVALTVPGSFAQSRDTSAVAAAVGTARLEGVVQSFGADPAPVRRAIVTVTGDGLSVGRSVVTDDQGRFVFGELPAGRFVVKADRPAHLPAAYGAVQPGQSPVPIQLAAGERRSDLVIAMARAGVITGILRTPTAEPAPGVNVGVFRVPPPGQNVALIPSGTAMTDDRGVYRVFDLPPGDYVVAAAISRALGTGDAEALSTEQTDRILRQLQARNPMATGPVPPEPTGPEPVGVAERRAWAPVYFPGSSSAEYAVPVRVRVGEERSGIDFTVSMTRMATVRGILLGDTAVVSGAQFFFNTVGRRLAPLTGLTPTFSTQVTSAGKEFTYTGVPPGIYAVTAHVTGDETWWARTEFHVVGDDIPDLALTLRSALTVSGRVVFEGLEVPPPGALKGATIRLAVNNGMGQSAAGGTRMGNPLIPAGQVEDDGSFVIRGVVPETFNVLVSAAAAKGWTPRSVLIEGRDGLDAPITIADDVSDVVVVMSNQPTRLAGRITTAAGAPAASLFIAVFPQDRGMWSPGGRRITSARAGTDGRWDIDGLPPGDYYIVALTHVGQDELADNAFLEQLLPSALRISLAPGQQLTQDLQIGR